MEFRRCATAQPTERNLGFTLGLESEMTSAPVSRALNQNTSVTLLSKRGRAATAEQEFYFVLDNHWNEAGHELAAELISDELLRMLESL